MTGEKAFRECKNLERVILPSTLKIIGDGTFQFTDVKIVDIPDGVEIIGDSAFWYCERIEKLSFGKGVKAIGKKAFCQCTSLTSIELPTEITEIAQEAFYFCKKLVDVKFPQGLKKIGSRVFLGCNDLSQVELPSGLEEIGESAFGGTQLCDVVIPASVKTVGYGAFARCDIPSFSVEKNGAFKVADGCLIDIANKKLVAGCPTSVIPDDGSVTSIAAAAFCGYDFDEDQAIVIPFAITEIEENAFTECSNLHIKCKVDEYEQPEGWHEYWYDRPREYYDEGYYEENDYLAYVEWDCLNKEERAEKDRRIREEKEATERFRLSQANDYIRENGVMTKYVGLGSEIVIPPDVTIIRAHCFDACDNVTSIKIHRRVSAVEVGTFDKFKDSNVQFYFQASNSPKGFSNYRFKKENLHFGGLTEEDRKQTEDENARRKLEELSLRGFEVQGEYLRKYDGNEEYVVLPYNDISTVSKEAFKDNTKIKTVHFGSVDIFWNNAFDGCVNLEKVILPDSVTNIPPAAFRNCEKLDFERLPALTREIGGGAFYNTGVQNVELNVVFIGDGAFAHCKKLKKVVINSDDVALRWQAFYDCPVLEEVEMNFELKELDWSVFEGCYSLKTVKLPDNLQIIGHGAFKDCKHLSRIEIPSTVTEIRSQAFLNCKALKDLVIPDSVTVIGDGAFLGCFGSTLRTTVMLPKRFEHDIRRIFGEWKDPFQFDDGPRFKFV